ncbi:RDH11 dehydrogenase, partial [Pseudoatta argentina]
MCTSKARLDGKTIVITGASRGLGKETARDLYARGARIILACRNMERANKAVEDIKNNPPSRINKDEYKNNAGELAIYSLDLCSLKSVKDCAKNLLTNETAIHILINNAGRGSSFSLEKTEDGSRKANNRQYAIKLWNASCHLLHLEPEEDFIKFLKTVSRQML